MNQRKDCLDDLMKGIFRDKFVRNTVKHKKKDLLEGGDIVFDKGFIDHVNNYTGRDRERLTTIMHIALLKVDAVYMKGKEEVPFNHDDVIRNAVEYLKVHGIDLSSELNNTTKEVIAGFIYVQIERQIIPAIFTGVGERKHFDDISEDYNLAFKYIEIAAFKFRTILKALDPPTDAIVITDPNAEEPNCAIPFDYVNSSILSDCCWEKPTISFRSFKINEWCYGRSKQDLYDEIVSGYVSYPFESGLRYDSNRFPRIQRDFLDFRLSMNYNIAISKVEHLKIENSQKAYFITSV